MTSRTVTGNTILLTGSAQVSQTVTFIKKSTTISGAVITQSGATTTTTDASGDFSKALDCPASGSTSWTLVTPDGSEFDFTLPYGDGSSVSVTTLISAPTVDADAVTLLLDGYEPDLGDPGTSGHVLSSTTAGVRSWVAVETSGAAATVQSNLDTHAALSTTAHGGILPEDAGIVAVSGARDLATTDRGRVLEASGTFAINCPDGISGNLQCAIAPISGTVTLTATTTLQYWSGGALVTASGAVTLNAMVTVYHAGTNVWRVAGDVSE